MEMENGVLKNGYDYELQCWVKDFKIQPCGHPETMRPGCCFSGVNAGADIREIYSRITSSGKYEIEQEGGQ